MSKLVALIVFLLMPIYSYANCGIATPPFFLENGVLVNQYPKKIISNIVIAEPTKVIDSELRVGAPSIHIMEYDIRENIPGLISIPFEIQSPCGLPLRKKINYILFISMRNEKKYLLSYLELESAKDYEMYKSLKSHYK